MFYALPVIACIILVSIDQIIKYFTVVTFQNVHNIEVIENLFYLTYTGNAGAAWGVLSGARMFFIITTVIALFFMAVYYVKMPECKAAKFARMALVLIISGALGNFIDRVFREGGKVVDMFHFVFWGYYDFPVFNFADILIVVGAVLLGIVIMFTPNVEWFPWKKKNDKG